VTDRPAPLLLYDGECALCHGAVRWIVRRDRRGTLRFAPLDGPTARAVRARHPELEGVDALVWVEAPGSGAERVAVASDAVLKVAGYLGGLWRLAELGGIIPGQWRDAAYAFVARHRRAFRRDACPTSPPDPVRFLA
jgi:predicted DCC family thiol-disulfide oxidoreductase YuxK